MSDLDLPLLPSADQIRRREFATIRRGYDPEQVRDYLLQVATQVETLEREARDAKLGRAKIDEATASLLPPGAPAPPGAPVPPPAPAEPAAGPDDAYEALAKRFSTLMSTADREATRIVSEAKAEASHILDEARSEADRIRVDAQARAEEARQQGSEALVRAREEADRLLSSLSDRRDSLVEQMQQMRSRLLAVAYELETEMGDAETRRPSVAGPLGTPPGTATGSTGDDSPVDPRYEDLWVSPAPNDSVDIPDLTAIDLDVDDEGSRD